MKTKRYRVLEAGFYAGQYCAEGAEIRAVPAQVRYLCEPRGRKLEAIEPDAAGGAQLASSQTGDASDS